MLAPMQTHEMDRIVPISERAQIAVIIKAITRIAEAWKLSNAEAASLFDVAPATWSRMKAGKYAGKLDQDKVTRASLLVGIFKGLRLLFNGPLTYGWPKMENSGLHFAKQSPVAFMMAGGIPAMMRVRQHIDALRGGL